LVTSRKDTALDVLPCLFFFFHSCKIKSFFKALRFVGFGISPKFADAFAAQGWNYALPQEDFNALFPRSCQKPVATDRCHHLTFCYANDFHRMRFFGLEDGEPGPTGSTNSGSGSSVVGFDLYFAIGFKLWEYNHYTACTCF
jgi:hypothetical protein